MKTLVTVPSLASLVALACASSGPSPELLDARRAYESARSAPAARYTPDRVLEAKQALDRAEAAHRDDPGSARERGLSYIAERRAELAVVYGDYERDRRDRNAADASYKVREDLLRRQAEASAAASRRELEGTRQTLASIASLQQIAKVKDDTRGTIITLDGSVLFVSGKSELLPIARQKLDEVAKALNDSDQQVTIEGHTDSNGNDDSNLRLSQSRADAVRSYLIQQGVKPERIEAIGKGETEPVASNDSAEGRANNRRVEIILHKKVAP